MMRLGNWRRVCLRTPKASVFPSIPDQRLECPSGTALYEPDHGSLLASGRTVAFGPGSLSPAAVSRVDAVAIPAAREARNLREAAKAARVAGRLLIVICSHKCRSAEVRRRLLEFDPHVPVLIVDLEGYAFPHCSRTLEWTLRSGWTSNTALKRNLALLLARRLGLRHVLFLDDDVRRVDAGQVKRSVAAIESGVHRAAGWKFVDFPDNAAVSHAYRALEKPRHGKQGCFIGGGGLLVRIDDDVPHFPMGIYNEDWLFLVPLLVRRQVKLLGLLKQEPYDPFHSAKNAQIQEFGDLIAESVMTLIARCGSVADLAGPPASLSFWQAEISRRQQFLKLLEADLVAENEQQYNEQQMVPPRLSRLDTPEPRHREKVLDAVRSASTALEGIKPRDLRDWTTAWQADEKAWRRLWTRLAPDTEAVTEAGPWSIGQVEGRIRALLADMGLATRVEYLWPTSPAAWDGSGRS